MPRKPTSIGPTPKTIAAREPLLFGNRPFIDFANSSYCPEGTSDPLKDWIGFLHFSAMTGAIDAASADSLASYTGIETKRALAEAATLRDSLAGLCEAVAKNTTVPEQVVSTLNTILAYEDGGFRLGETTKGFSMSFTPSKGSALQSLTAIARSAADFICNDQLGRLRACSNAHCPLYFYDTSKNGRRRWCRMDVCGNRSKAADHYKRSKQ
ncbi:MAG: hypothetical protein HN793_03045 [Rhodospirillaceae bacterium]|jgi:predicted RNA-binding Zn ribbon-like protein|nr:hypothetical protein [Rhodospirillaceae bacterium]MBT5565412.1 hypothetical protein [Rhodospirillaceae bacterium]MBT6089273.1 hypothetical protein [Rhodospirillaceae bacterium]MBT6962138.1 hypothetical protein [Rhodospirillaceae bacterium]MBT7449782.1 hypothetical protein [Rhodospirillaceae bacterium]